jgi:hypothetical protein
VASQEAVVKKKELPFEVSKDDTTHYVITSQVVIAIRGGKAVLLKGTEAAAVRLWAKERGRS